MRWKRFYAHKCAHKQILRPKYQGQHPRQIHPTYTLRATLHRRLHDHVHRVHHPQLSPRRFHNFCMLHSRSKLHSKVLTCCPVFPHFSTTRPSYHTCATSYHHICQPRHRLRHLELSLRRFHDFHALHKRPRLTAKDSLTVQCARVSAPRALRTIGPRVVVNNV